MRTHRLNEKQEKGYQEARTVEGKGKIKHQCGSYSYHKVSLHSASKNRFGVSHSSTYNHRRFSYILPLITLCK